MTTFQDAHEVRRHVKAAGYTGKIKVRWVNFDYSGLFFVLPTDDPVGVAVAFGTGGTFTSDRGETAKKYARLREVLEGTNAKVG